MKFAYTVMYYIKFFSNLCNVNYHNIIKFFIEERKRKRENDRVIKREKEREKEITLVKDFPYFFLFMDFFLFSTDLELN